MQLSSVDVSHSFLPVFARHMAGTADGVRGTHRWPFARFRSYATLGTIQWEEGTLVRAVAHCLLPRCPAPLLLASGLQLPAVNPDTCSSSYSSHI